jgi:GGDEF domain-containing protein
MTGPSTQVKERPQKLSTAQMLHLMRLETQQALRNGQPVSCMVIGLDGFEGPDALGACRELMPPLFRILKVATFETGVRGLGVFTERLQVAIFPYLAPKRAEVLAGELLERARELSDPRPESGQAVTISIGISHNQHKEATSFETIVEEAERGMEMARSGGGDRFLLARDIESELDQLQDELQEQIREIQEFQDVQLSEQDGLEESWGKKLIEQTLALFENEPEKSGAVLRLQKAVMSLITTEISNWRNSSSVRRMIESHKQVDMLERRVNKLTESLGVTESELKRIAALKNIDLGISSIYRTVQGISDDDSLAEQKKELLKDIFEANLELREELAAKDS